MTSMVEKRKEYVDIIENIKTSVENDVKKYEDKLTEELNEKVKNYRAELMTKNALIIDRYTKRILMLDDIIKEEMPGAVTLAEEVSKPDLEPVLNEDEPIEQVDSVKEFIEPLEPIDNNIFIDSTNTEPQFIEEVNFDECVVNGTHLVNEDRPGMASITNPVRE